MIIQTDRGWLKVEGEWIAEIGEGISTERIDIDARGKLVLPGVIDSHVHLREPGMEWKGDMHSETRAAVAGGVTSIMDMPNTKPATTSREQLERKMEMAAERSMCNYGFWLGATADNLEEIRRIDPRMVAGIKVFMGSSTGGMLLDDDKILSAVFAESPTIIGVHCEDEAIVRANMERFRVERGHNVDASIHPLIRTTEACYRSTARARYGSNLHVLHLSTARELSLFDEKPLTDKKITAEACVHHLWFSDEDYAAKGNLIKVNPAIKTPEDREALRAAILSGRIDTVATDHAPHTLDEKLQNYWDAPSGAPAIQHSLCSMLSLFPVETVVEKMCHAPARRFGIKDRGFLHAGMRADIVIVAHVPQVVSKPLYKCAWSPQQGLTLTHTVETTMINGRIVYDCEQFNEDYRGEALQFR